MMPDVDSRGWYLVLLLVVTLERLFEQALAGRHARQLRQRGGFEVGREHYPWMVLMHAAFLVACALEVWWGHRPWLPLLGGAMLALLIATMVLRYWVITTLGDRWTTRIFVVPGEERIRGGPYRWLHHPNYLAVRLEVLALPLIHGAWLTAIIFSILNAWLLAVRIRAEDRALDACEARS